MTKINENKDLKGKGKLVDNKEEISEINNQIRILENSENNNSSSSAIKDIRELNNYSTIDSSNSANNSNNKEVAKFNFSAEIIKGTKFKNILDQDLENLRKEKEKFAYQKFPERSDFYKFVSMFDSDDTLGKEDRARNRLMAINSDDIYQTAITSFGKTAEKLESWANKAVKNVIENNQLEITKCEDEIKEKDIVIDEKDKVIDALNNEIEILLNDLREKETSLKDNQNERKILEERLEDFKSKLAINEIDWTELNKYKRLSINSSEHFLSDQLKGLTSKYEHLEEKSLTDKELLKIKGEELREYIKLANQFATSEISLNEEINSLRSKLSSYSKKIIELESNILSIDFKILSLNEELRKEIVKKKELENRLSVYQREYTKWEESKKKYKADIEERKALLSSNQEIFNKTSLENARLADEIIDLKDTIEKGTSLVANLETKITNKDKEIKELTADLKSENRKKKVLTASSWIRYAGSWVLDEKKQTNFDTFITGATSAYVLKDLDNWSYEVAWMGIGLMAWTIIKKFIRWWNKEEKQTTTIINNTTREIVEVEKKVARKITPKKKTGKK